MKKKNLAYSHLHFACSVPAILWQFLFLYIPLFFVIVITFLDITDSGKIVGITLSNLLYFFQPLFFKIIASSLGLALATALICLSIGFPLAYFMHFPGRRYKVLLLFFLLIPFWTSFLLHIYSWFYVLEHQGVVNTLLLKLGLISKPLNLLGNLFSILLMMVYTYLPFMVLPLYSSMENFDNRLLEASQNLGASWLQTIRTILIPLTSKGLRSGFFLVFIPSFGEFAIPELMGGDRTFFVGNTVSFLILGEQTGCKGEAFTLLSMGVLVIVALLILKVFNLLIKDRRQTDES